MTRHEQRLDAALDLLSGIDGKLLRKQREWLIKFESYLEEINRPHHECSGLISLTNAIADYLADHLGDDSALLTESWPTIPAFTFESDADVEKYLDWLIEHGMTYHFDDLVEDAFSHESKAVIDQLEKNDEALTDYCNPWEFFDKYPHIFARYMGTEKGD